MKGALGLVDDHFVAAAHEDCDGPGVGALLDDQHLVACCSESQLADDASLAELLGAEVLETWYNASVGGNGNQLDLGPAYPPHGWQLVCEQKVVGLVVEAPLADDDVGAGVLDLIDHLGELVGLVALELLELFDRGNIELVLGLGLRGLEGACEDGELGVADLGGHLGMGKVLVYYDALDQQCVLEGTADLAVDLDELKVDVLAVKVCDGQDGIDGDVGELVVGLGDNLASQTGPGDAEQLLGVVLCEVDLVADFVEAGDGDLAGLVVAVCDADGVDALVNEVGGLAEQGAGEDDDAGGAVADLIVLGLGELDEQLGDVVGDFHLGEDGGAVICDGDVAVGGDEDLVQTARALRVVSQRAAPPWVGAYQRCLDQVRDCLGGQNVRLDRLVAVLPLLLALAACCQRPFVGSQPRAVRRHVLSDDNEGAAGLVLHHLGCTVSSVGGSAACAGPGGGGGRVDSRRRGEGSAAYLATCRDLGVVSIVDMACGVGREWGVSEVSEVCEVYEMCGRCGR